MTALSFTEVWQRIQTHLTPGTTVRNWTAKSKYLGDTMQIVDVSSNGVRVEAPNAETILYVPVKDFENLWKIWGDYKTGRVNRQKITEITRVSKYVISIFHWMEVNSLV